MRFCKARFDKKLTVLIMALFITALQAQLQRQGSIIVDESGQEVVLRGYGLGGWLVPEGYQLKIPGFGSPTDIHNKMVDLIGEANTDAVETLYRANYVTEDDIAQIKAWGFNSIRLPFNYRLLSPPDEPEVFLEEGFELLDKVLEWCQNHELYLILDMHCAPGGQSKDQIADADGIEARLWTEPENQDRIVELWKRIAQRYVGEKWIGGYDLINEPVLPSGYTNQDLRALYMRILSELRPVDPDHLVFIEGNWYATSFDDLTPPFDAQMVYSFHKYWNETTQATIQYLINMRRNTNIPLWLGETGENSNVWFANCVKLMNDQNIGWNWWTHKKVSTLTSPYSAVISDDYQRVLDYWNGQGAKPSVALATKGLMELAESLKLNLCETRPGVIPALTDPEFLTTPKAVKKHSIPGRVAAVDYDLGSQGIAYFDNDYENVKGNGGAQWNTGWQYRNDGVDIEASQDNSGPAYSVGWMATGEWLHYTVEATDAGTYELSIRASSGNGQGHVLIEINGQTAVSNFRIPSSGGWYSWRDHSAGTVFLNKGANTVKLYVLSDGFNLSALDFRLIQTDVKHSHMFPDNLPDDVRMDAAYPNPFSNQVNIPLEFAKSVECNLSLFDVAGRMIRSWSVDNASAGRVLVSWDGTDNQDREVPAGVYFVRMRNDRKIQAQPVVLFR